MIAQVVVSKLRPDGTRSEFLALTGRLVTWLERQPGFVSYEVYDGGAGAWADRIVWATVEDARRATDSFLATDIAAGFSRIVDPDYRGIVGRIVDLKAE